MATPRIRWPFLVALALSVVALAVRYTALTGGAGAGTVPGQQLTLLEGVTGQGTKFELGLLNHRVYRLRTTLRARCRGGSSVQETWYPAEHAPVHFTVVGRTFTTIERSSPTYKNGEVGRIAFTIRGTLIGKNAAQGTIRLVGRYYQGEREWNACDSLDVAWAVGPGAQARLRGDPGPEDQRVLPRRAEPRGRPLTGAQALHREGRRDVRGDV